MSIPNNTSHLPTFPPHQPTIVVSLGQSRNPEKRDLEEAVIRFAESRTDVRTLVIQHLYDLPPQGESFQTLRNLQGPIILVSWIYGRAAHWVLDRHNVRGQVGEVLLTDPNDDEDEEDLDEDSDSNQPDQDAEPRMIDLQPRPPRDIYCIDFKLANQPQPLLEELDRILLALNPPEKPSSPRLSDATQARFANPTNDTALSLDQLGRLVVSEALNDHDLAPANHQSVVKIEEASGRRWYPVIDFSRCTNCMECIDFCLFGVYGVDQAETILVEQPDNCRKGCPACSRVCPANAIIFPQHKTPAIAGANVEVSGLKIDLSKLFGAPDRDEDAAAAAARERDEQLILAGRQAVSQSSATPSSPHSSSTPAPSSPQDSLDQLLDQLDASDV